MILQKHNIKAIPKKLRCHKKGEEIVYKVYVIKGKLKLANLGSKRTPPLYSGSFYGCRGNDIVVTGFPFIEQGGGGGMVRRGRSQGGGVGPSQR